MLFQVKDVREKKEQKVEETLLDNYNNYYRLAYSYVHNEDDASDIVQNGAYKAILNSNALKNEEYAATWIYHIMLNEIFRFLKKQSNDSKKTCISLDEVNVNIGKDDTYENIDLKRALDDMPVKDKAIIEMKYFHDMKLEEIAEVLEENVNTIKSRLYRGL